MGYFAQDGLDSIRQMTDSSGNLTYAANFDPYGYPLEQNLIGGTTNLGYTGAPSDPSGLVYLNARFYNLSIGAFQKSQSVGNFALKFWRLFVCFHFWFRLLTLQHRLLSIAFLCHRNNRSLVRFYAPDVPPQPFFSAADTPDISDHPSLHTARP